MRRKRRPRVTCLGRFIRGRRPDHNPLRRRSDRVETAFLAGLLIAFLAGAPFAAQACGAAAHAIAHREQLAQQASWHQVRAVVLRAAPGTDSSSGGYAAIEPEVLARWRAPDGALVTGQIPVPAGTANGATVLVWTAANGQVTDPPLQNAQVAGQTVLARMLGVVALAVALTVIGMLVRRALNRRRIAAWDADWLATGPRWTSRR